MQISLITDNQKLEEWFGHERRYASKVWVNWVDIGSTTFIACGDKTKEYVKDREKV